MKTIAAVLSVVALSMSIALAQVKTGADILLTRSFHMIKGKRVGLVTNHSARLSDGRHLADALFARKDTRLTVLFGPEHGIRGDAPDGRTIQHGVDATTGLPVYSLYGKINTPTDEMLKDVDVLVFDIQDIGARFYTYESTLSLTIEAAAERNIPYIVLDRPNPIRGTWVEGFIRVDSMRSFVGLHPIPIAHGMTIGELALLFNGEGWLKDGKKANLTVICAEGWKRAQWQDETGQAWIKPSPNMATLRTAVVYPGTCLFEGTNLSEGRGTERPFEYLGAPYVDGQRWADMLNTLHLPGVEFHPVEFTPKEIPNVASNPKYNGMECGGIFVDVKNRDEYEPVATSVYILSAAKHLFAQDFQWRTASIDRLSGTPSLRLFIDAGVPPERIVLQWKAEVGEFMKVRAKYLMYQ